VLAEEADAEARATHLDRIETILDEWEAMTEEMRQVRQLTTSPEAQQPAVEVRSVTEHLTAWNQDTEFTLDVNSTVSREPTVWIPGIVTEALEKLITTATHRATESDTVVTVSLSDKTDKWVGIEVFITGSGLTETDTEVLATGEETALTHAQGLDIWVVRTMIRTVGGEITAQTTGTKTRVTFRIPMKQPPDDKEA
jgi:sensor histidine kinase regulating citrate/malate metabolism